uniref:Uncharacterized protein n=1 Tax=Anguilla anguilla TaxID=7936 RepID=A0A0E9SJV2_ANGAN
MALSMYCHNSDKKIVGQQIFLFTCTFGYFCTICICFLLTAVV